MFHKRFERFFIILFDLVELVLRNFGVAHFTQHEAGPSLKDLFQDILYLSGGRISYLVLD
jgi:hypothetical protein